MIRKVIPTAFAGMTVASYLAGGLAVTLGYIVGCLFVCGFFLLAYTSRDVSNSLYDGIGDNPQPDDKLVSLLDDGEHQDAAIEGFARLWESSQSKRPDEISMGRLALEVYWFDHHGELLDDVSSPKAMSIMWSTRSKIFQYIGRLGVLTSTVFTPSCSKCAENATGAKLSGKRACLKRCYHCDQFFYEKPLLGQYMLIE